MKITDFEKFKEPFPEKDIEWRLQTCGSGKNGVWALCLAYITSRAVQERLDTVCGPDGWKTSIIPVVTTSENSSRPGEKSSSKNCNAFLCELSIRVTHDDGTVEWISRVDGADATDIEPVKGGISGALKRVAVQFGIGRYLYNLEENFAQILPDGSTQKGYPGKTKEGQKFKWLPPKLPAWALPKGTTNKKSAAAPEKVPTEEVPAEEAPVKLTPEELEELNHEKVKLQDWIKSGVLGGDYLKKANWYLTNNDLKGIKSTNKWCSEQAETA